MKLLEDRIISDGKVLPGNVLKVSSFLNHQVDVPFLLEMGKHVQQLFKDDGVNKIVTVEASGIAIATAFAAVMNVPVVFAKKHNTSNISGQVFCAATHSYTHGIDYNMIIEKQFLSPQDRVLIVDDFLANGQALGSLINIVEMSGAELVGCAIAIEKSFQGGGDKLRARGIRVESLAVIDGFEDGTVRFHKQRM